MKPEKPTPRGWPRISAALFYSDPRAAIDWLCRAFGFEGLIMVAGTGTRPGKEDPWRKQIASPKQLGGRFTQNLCLHVDDADAHCATARAAGAVVCYEPTTTDYGGDYWADRSYAAYDLEGHMWWFMQRISTGGKPHA